MSLKDQLIIPVYLNEKTVLDMLAIIEDGFSMVSEVSSSNQNSSTTDLKLGSGLSTKAMPLVHGQVFDMCGIVPQHSVYRFRLSGNCFFDYFKRY